MFSILNSDRIVFASMRDCQRRNFLVHKEAQRSEFFQPGAQRGRARFLNRLLRNLARSEGPF